MRNLAKLNILSLASVRAKIKKKTRRLNMTKKISPAERIKQYRYSTDREESCTAHLSLRIPPSQKAKLKQVEGWQEEVRKLIEELTDRATA